MRLQTVGAEQTDHNGRTYRAGQTYGAEQNYGTGRAAPDKTTGTIEAAADSAAVNRRVRETGVPEPADAQTGALPRTWTPAQPLYGQEIADSGSTLNGSTPVERLRSSQSEPDAAAMDGNSPAENDAGDIVPAPPANEATSVRAESEVASLRIPSFGARSPLRGSLESLERQNTRLDAEGLERIEDENDLAARIAYQLLVPVPVSTALTVNSELLENHRYCRPWTARFLADLAKAHEALFHRPLEVSSAVRTVEYQRRLMMINGNAAAAEGDVVSPHLTGATVDIAKQGLTRQEMAWMRQQLLALQTAGKIDVEEEFRQACFHITVYKDYAPERLQRPAVEAKSATRRSKRRPAPAADSQSASTIGM